MSNDKTDQANVPPATPPGGTPAAPAPKRKRSKWVRRILIGVGGVVVLLILLVLMLPTIAGSGTVRGIVVDQVNKALSGHLTITDWSFSWTGGLKITGVDVKDSKQSHVLSVKEFSTGLSLLGAAKGNYALGKTSLDGVDFFIVRQKDGQLNLMALAKGSAAPASPAPAPSAPSNVKPSPAPSTPPPAAASAPINLPALTGDFVLSNCTGTFQDDISNRTIQVKAIDGELKIDDLNKPIIDSLTITSGLIGGPASTIKIDGSFTAIKNGQLDVSKIIDILSADQTITVTNLDLSTVTPMMAIASPTPIGATMSGILTSKYDLHVKPGGAATITSSIDVPHLVVGGSVLNGDTFDAGELSLNLDASATGVDPTSRVKVNTLNFKTRQVTLGVNVDAAQGSLSELGTFLPQIIDAVLHARKTDQTITLPGSAAGGTVAITLHADVPGIVNQLPHMARLNSGTTLTSGTLDHSTNVTIAQDKVTVAIKTDIALAGTSDGKPVSIPKFSSDLGVSATGGKKPSIGDLKANIDSSFLTLNTAAPSLAQLNATGNINLDDLQSKLAALFNLGTLTVGGTGKLALNSTGDPTAPNGVVKATNSIEFTNLKISGLGSLPPVTRDRLAIGLTGDITNDSAAVVQAIHNIELTVQAGPAAAPVVDMHAKADASMAGPALAATFQLDKCIVDCPRLVAEQKDLLTAMGKPATKPAANAPAAPPSLLAQLGSGEMTLPSGTVNLTAGGSYDSTGVNLSTPLALGLHNFTLVAKDGNSTRNLLDNESADFTMAGKISTQNGIAADLSTLSLTTSDGVISLSNNSGQHLVFSRNSAGAISGSGTITAQVKLKRGLTIAQGFSGPAQPTTQPTLQSGQLAASIGFSHAANGKSSDVNGDIKITALTVASPTVSVLNNETIDMPIKASLADDGTTATASVGANTSMGNFSANDINVLLARMVNGKAVPADTLDMLQSAHIVVANADIPKIRALLNAITPPSSGPAVAAAAGNDTAANPNASAAPPPPMVIKSGVANADITVARKAQSTTFAVNNLAVSKLALTCGDGAYAWDKDITFKAAASIDTAVDPNKQQALMDEIKAVNIQSLDGDLGVASISLGAPIVVKDLSAAKPTYSGTINVNGDIAGLSRVAEATSGLKSGAYPYAGTLALSNALSTEAAGIRVVQTGGVKNFQEFAADGKTVQFTEAQIGLNTHMAVNLDTRTLLMDGDGVNVTMASSKALGIKLTGTLHDWQTARQFQDVKLGLDYDLATLWKIILPMLTPDQQTSYKDLKLAGKYHRDFVLGGSFPAGPAFNVAIRSLLASGDLTVDTYDLNGLTIQNLDVPVDIKSGIVRIAYNGKPAGQDLPVPATFNSGKLDLGGITLDLSDVHPRLNVPANKALIAQATINPVFANTWMKDYINNPVFADPQSAKGLLDITMVSCIKLPLDALMNSTGPENDGRAEVRISITGFQIGSSMIGDILGAVGGRGNNAIDGDIKNGKLVIEKGLAEQDMTINISGEKYGLRLFGTVGLLNKTLQPYTVGIPGAMFAKFGKANAKTAAFLPAEVDCPLKGTVSSPKLDTSGLLKALADAEAKSLFGGGSNPPSTTAPAGPKNNNPLNQLQNLFPGGK